MLHQTKNVLADQFDQFTGQKSTRYVLHTASSASQKKMGLNFIGTYDINNVEQNGFQ